jgi:hypothetical protein
VRLLSRAALPLLFAAGGAAAATAPSPYASDSRIELLGVVQWLSGERPDLPADPAYRDAVEQAFAPLRGHPAVSLWRDGARKRGKMDGRAIDVLYFSEPPALAPRPGWAPPYLDDPAEAADFAALLPALRDFAKKSDFMRFHKRHEGDYRRVCAAAASELGVADPLAAVSRYVGLDLEARARWLVSPLFVPSGRNAYITPYPDPETLPAPGEGPFETATILAYVPGKGPLGDIVTQRHRAALWQEPLFVFIDPALAAFDAARGAPAEDYYGPAVAACRRDGADCAKNWIVAALSARLDVGAFGAPSNLPDGRDPRRDEYVAALSARLAEYEKDRAPGRTLWDFMPRLMAVFPEKAGLSPAAPALRRVRDVKELFPGAAKAAAP